MQDFFEKFITPVASPLAERFSIVWQQGVAGHDVRDILVALAIVVFTLLVRRPIAWLMVSWLKALAQRFRNDWLDDEMVVALRGPVRALPIWIGLSIAVEVLQLAPRVQLFLDRCVASFGMVLLFWTFFRVMLPISRQFARFEGSMTRSMINWLTKGIRFFIILLGVAAVMNIWGVQIGPILAGLGIFGVAVALGAQDMFKNLIAGALILTEKRFEVGDWILVQNVVEGDVERIGFRSTLVRRFDKAPVYVPNAKLSDDAVINYSRMTFRRIFWTIGVEYRTTQKQIDAICNDIMAYMASQPDIVPNEQATAFAGIDKFSENAIDLQIICFSKKIRFAEFALVKANLAAKIKEIIESHNAGFAFPSRTVYVEAVGDLPLNPVQIAAASGA